MINKQYEAKRKADKHLHFNFIITNASDGTFDLNVPLRKKINSWNVVEAPANIYEMMRTEEDAHLCIQKNALDLIREHAISIKNYGYLLYNFNKSASGRIKYLSGRIKYLFEPSIMFIYDYRENKNLEYILHCSRYNSEHPSKMYCVENLYDTSDDKDVKLMAVNQLNSIINAI